MAANAKACFELLCSAGEAPGTAGSVVQNLPAPVGDARSILGWEGAPGEGNGHTGQYSVWEVLWTEELGGLQSMGPQRVRHGFVTKHQ